MKGTRQDGKTLKTHSMIIALNLLTQTEDSMFTFISVVTLCIIIHIVKITYLIISIVQDDKKSTSSK